MRAYNNTSPEKYTSPDQLQTVRLRLQTLLDAEQSIAQAIPQPPERQEHQNRGGAEQSQSAISDATFVEGTRKIVEAAFQPIYASINTRDV